MSQFTDFKSVLIPTWNSTLFEIWEDLVYERYYEWSWIYIVVPKWFKTDFASIPIILQILVKPYDPRWILWSIIHDYLFSKARTLKEFQDANDVFYEAIQVTGTPKYLAVMAYLWVSVSKYVYYFFAKINKRI